MVQVWRQGARRYLAAGVAVVTVVVLAGWTLVSQANDNCLVCAGGSVKPGVPWWVWLLVGILVLAGIGFVVLFLRRRSKEQPEAAAEATAAKVDVAEAAKAAETKPTEDSPEPK